MEKENRIISSIKEVTKNMMGKVSSMEKGLRNINKKPEEIPNVKVGIRG